MALRRLSALDVSGRAVFVRVDINCPISSSGDVADDTRIVASLPTLRYLLDKGARVVLASHLGRPKGKRDPKQSLKPVHAALSRYLKSPIGFSDSIVGAEAEAAAARLAPGEALLLENLRFDPRQEANDLEFSRALARLGEAYVNDAFGAAHRAHASTVGIKAFLAERAAGYLMEKEHSVVRKLLEGAESPKAVTLVAPTISREIDVVRNLLAVFFFFKQKTAYEMPSATQPPTFRIPPRNEKSLRVVNAVTVRPRNNRPVITAAIGIVSGDENETAMTKSGTKMMASATIYRPRPRYWVPREVAARAHFSATHETTMKPPSTSSQE